jgi:hypothetical protein
VTVKSALPSKVNVAELLARFGLKAEALSAEKAKEMRLRMSKGIVITEVEDGFFKGPAPKPGDVLARIGEVRPNDLEHAARLLESTKPGQQVSMVFLRQKDKDVFRYDVTTTLAK